MAINVRESRDIDFDQILASLAEICRHEPLIVAAYVFGSASSRKMRRPGDIDLAILVEPGHEESFPLLALAALSERACGLPVDLVLLNRAGEVLKHQVRRHGSLIFERNPGKRKAFEIKGRKLYEDFLHLHNTYVRSVLYGKTE